jgi:uncharacterized membrane protein YhaH (DUF805 family)
MKNLAAALRLSRFYSSASLREGTIGRASYFFWGFGLFCLKYFIDSLTSNLVFHRQWAVYNYIVPGKSVDILALSPEDKVFFATLLVTALPFIWAGVLLTIQRLRAANLPIWLAKLFFIPFINFLFFAILCIYPNQERSELISLQTKASDIGSSKPGGDSGRGDFLSASLTPVPFAVFFTFLGASWLKTYGWGLFVGIPFAVGMSAAYLCGRNQSQTYWRCLAAASLSLTVVGVGIFFLAWEGIVCLAMAAPIAYALAAIGAIFGYHLQKGKVSSAEGSWMMIILLCLFPTLMGAEYKSASAAPFLCVRTSIVVPAAPCVVWQNVVSFSSLPEPHELIFKLGIAYPVKATIDGHGPGAVRKCEFSTGAFIEPIRVWDEPKELTFGVTAQPPSMQESGIRRDIHPAHLSGYLNVQAGQFELKQIQMPNGSTGTLLTGATWYQNQMWPNCYWRLWSDYIIHRIHTRVLNHIAALATRNATSENPINRKVALQ